MTWKFYKGPDGTDIGISQTNADGSYTSLLLSGAAAQAILATTTPLPSDPIPPPQVDPLMTWAQNMVTWGTAISPSNPPPPAPTTQTV